MSRPKDRGIVDGHETPAEEIKTLALLIPHLCDAAFATKRHREQDLRPERCASCDSACCYGERLMELMRERGIDYSCGRRIYSSGEIALALRTAPVETDIRRVLKRGKRSAHK